LVLFVEKDGIVVVEDTFDAQKMGLMREMGQIFGQSGVLVVIDKRGFAIKTDVSAWFKHKRYLCFFIGTIFIAVLVGCTWGWSRTWLYGFAELYQTRKAGSSSLIGIKVLALEFTGLGAVKNSGWVLHDDR
jgi:hypothetical protein